jgi:glycosyltransferase involved in cell wall biosynthesis
MSDAPLHLLCVEPRFPGRLGAVADWLVRKRGYRCTFYCTTTDTREPWPAATGKGLEIVVYKLGGVARDARVPWTRQLERSLCYAFGCWEALEANRPRPIDVVLGRSAGLGSTLFVPVHLPGVPVVNLFDYYYHAHAHDLAEDAASTTPASYFHWRRSANALELLDLENGVQPWTPTCWQRDLFPKEYHAQFLVLHDGIDTRRFRRHRTGSRSIGGRTIPDGMRVVTFVARTLEALRGFDRFLECANRLLRARSDVICVAAGGHTVRRGLDVTFFNQDYRAQLLAQHAPSDPERLWLLGDVPQTTVAELFAASDLHLYPSRPYAVSRSLIEAMASGCTILAADTVPVRELLTHGKHALLVPPNDADAWESMARKVLDDPAGHASLGQAAAERARAEYARDVTLPKLARCLQEMVESRG